MFVENGLGESLYKTWSKKQRHEEIARLVTAYRSGLSVGILCKMAEAITGSRKQARKCLQAMLTAEERQAAFEKETQSMQLYLKDFLL